MSATNDILKRVHFVETIDGVDFTLRRISAGAGLRIIGKKALGIVRGAGGAEKELTEADHLELISEMMPKYLKAAMVSPKLGDTTDADNDTISLDDLGEYAIPVFNAVVKGSGFGEARNFTASPEDTTGERSAKS